MKTVIRSTKDGEEIASVSEVIPIQKKHFITIGDDMWRVVRVNWIFDENILDVLVEEI